MAKRSKQVKRKAAAGKARASQAKQAGKRGGSRRKGTPKRAVKAPPKKTAKKPAKKPAKTAASKTPKRAKATTTTKTTKTTKTAKAAKVAKKVAPKKKAGASGAKPATGARPSVADRARKAVARSARRAAAAAAPKSREATPKPEKKRKARVRTKSPFSRRALVPLRTMLLDMRTRLVGDIDLMGREALRADDSDVDAENVADHGTDAFERHMTLELMENEARTLRQINQALDLMDGGRYGLCGVCSEPIPIARLQALPFAENCVGCQTAQERGY